MDPACYLVVDRTVDSQSQAVESAAKQNLGIQQMEQLK